MTTKIPPSISASAGPDNLEARGMFTLADGRRVGVTFALVTSLFLLWGFCNGMIDVMDKHFQAELHLTLAQSAWVQFAHYLGYFLMSLPAGWLATRLGYKGGIITGLLMVAVGGLWFIPATKIAAFWAFLLGVCIIASGLTFLETIANPYTTVLGPPRFAATRINLAQSSNGIGWIFGPIVGGMFFYGKDAAGNSTGSQTLWIPYAAVAAVVIVLVIVFAFANVPDVLVDETRVEKDVREGHGDRPLRRRPHFLLAVATQFFYVAAQAGIFSFFINYMTSQVPAISDAWAGGALARLFESRAGATHISDQGAATLASGAFVCFLLGRLGGAGLLRRFAAHRVLALYGLLNVVVCLLIVLKLGWLSVACVFLSYFFMSIMFPTIFALGIHDLGGRAKQASAFIVMAIMGGAVLPKLMGYVADHSDMSRAFVVPLGCFALVALYAWRWPSLSGSTGLSGTRPARH